MRVPIFAALLGMFAALSSLSAADADLILYHGKIVTVDKAFSVQSALAIGGGRILAVGGDADILKLKSDKTELIDLGGKMVLPGLIDSHTHPTWAAPYEYDHPIPQMETIQDILDFIAGRAAKQPEGSYILVEQAFVTRLKEQRFPTRAELDKAAPNHAVIFRTGPDAMLNTFALTLNQITRATPEPGTEGRIEKDAAGEPTGMLRNFKRFVKPPDPPALTPEIQCKQLGKLFADYNAWGITSICDRDASLPNLELYKLVRDTHAMTVRVFASRGLPNYVATHDVLELLKDVAADPLFTGKDEWLRIIGVKMYLDGGMLTGSAYMREPWGISPIYGIIDPSYRGVLYIPKEKLHAIVKAATELKIPFTAHSVGDGAVQTLLETYADIGRELPIKALRPCLTHANFQGKDLVALAADSGVMMDMQPVWLYLDVRTLEQHFGAPRMRYFQPLKSLFTAGVNIGGGSDHMLKIGAMRGINPYNPFLGIATAVTRRAKWRDGPFNPDESLSREQAIRMFTANNAYLLFAEDRIGSLEAGKCADFVIIDRDILTCPEGEIQATKALRTFVNGKTVYQAPSN